MRFANRTEAGRRLAGRLAGLRDADPVVLGLPRGGVAVAHEVASALAAPLDVIVVRKLGLPYQPELAMGAIGEGGVRVLNERVVRSARVGEEQISAVEKRERARLEARVRRLRGSRPPQPLAGRTAVIVDDGIATGATARAACLVARAAGAARVVLAVPVAPPESVERLAQDADEVVCLYAPEAFYAVGEWYRDFGQVSDAQVTELLERAARERAQTVPGGAARHPQGGGETGQ